MDYMVKIGYQGFLIQTMPLDVFLLTFSDPLHVTACIHKGTLVPERLIQLPTPPPPPPPASLSLCVASGTSVGEEMVNFLYVHVQFSNSQKSHKFHLQTCSS